MEKNTKMCYFESTYRHPIKTITNKRLSYFLEKHKLYLFCVCYIFVFPQEIKTKKKIGLGIPT